MFDLQAFDAHESVHVFHDADSGLEAVIAIHSTGLGPAAGGCRMWPYQTSEAAIVDVLRLSQGMSYKNAMAGLPLGGGKAVIKGDPRTGKSPDLFRAFGRAVESLGGQYWTAEDVGIETSDMAVTAEETRYVAGLTSGTAASGDPSPVTALGVFRGVKACAERAFGSSDLNGRIVAVQGVGSVGGHLCDHLADAGAQLVVTDIDTDALRAVSGRTGAEIVEPEAIYSVQADIFSPNALGAVINPDTIKRLSVKVIAGGANNQLVIPDMGEMLRRKGILYAPDYVINGGGIINVAAEISGKYDRGWVDEKLAALTQTLEEVLDEALRMDRATNAVADAMAKARIGRG